MFETFATKGHSPTHCHSLPLMAQPESVQLKVVVVAEVDVVVVAEVAAVAAEQQLLVEDTRP